jgi:uncharacterized protein YjiS (DUF1127 family)
MTHYTENCPRGLVASPAGITTTALELLRRSLHTWRLRNAIRRERAQLLSMSAAQLNDIGIDRSAAIAEANRSDIPAARNR